jgi:hypothetical protein
MIEEPTPDGVPCRHCGQPIFWDEICWVHHNGFADCDLTISGGTKMGAWTIDPMLTPTTDPALKDKRAEPVGDWT